MKNKTTTAKPPLSAEELMLEKRDALVSQRDELLAELYAKIEPLNADISSLDSVLSMFNPRHVPLEIRKVQGGTPLLTLTAQPFLTEERTSLAETGTVEAKANPTGKKAAVKAEAKKPGPKPKIAVSQEGETPEARLAAVVADKAKKVARAKAKAKKLDEAARDIAKTYFAEINKLKTLLEIVQSEPDGIPFRRVKELFLERHPLDVTTKEMKKVFGDRLSSILYSMSQGQNPTVSRSERQGDDGKKESFWVSSRRSQAAASNEAETQSAA